MSVVSRDTVLARRFSFRRILSARFRDEPASKKALKAYRAEALEGRCLLSAVTWTGARNNGFWSDPLNWTGGTGVPTAADDVTIASGFSTVSVSFGSQAAHSISSASPLQISTILDVATTMKLSANLTLGGTLKHAAVTFTGGASLVATSGVLDTITLNGNLDLTQTYAAQVAIYGGLTLNGTAYVGNATGSNPGYMNFGNATSPAGSLSGTGTVLFGAAGDNSIQNATSLTGTAGVLTIGSGITIHGKHGEVYNYLGTSGILNQGTINADVAGGTIWAGFDFAGTFSNTGVMKATAGTLNLMARYSSATMGTIQAAGGPVNILGTISGGLALNASTGSWTLAGQGTIAGGTVTQSGGAKLLIAGGALQSVTFNGDLDMSQQSRTLNIYGGLVLNGTAYLGKADGSTYGILSFGGFGDTAGSLTGNGTVQFGANPNNAILNNARLPGTDGTLTIGPGITVHGGVGSLSTYPYYDMSSIVNQGTISTDGGNIALGKVSNSGVIKATAGTLTTSGAWSNTGMINVTNSTVTLGGTFSFVAPGTFVRSGGTVNLIGTISGGLALNAATGSWNLAGGTIAAGTFSASGGAMLLMTNKGGTLNAVTFNADLDLSQQSTGLTVLGGLVLNGTAYLGNGVGTTAGFLNFGDDLNAAGSLSGSGTVLFGSTINAVNALVNRSKLTGANGTLTIGPGITIHGGSGLIYNVYDTAATVNQGTINADSSLGTITLFRGKFSNTGTMEATAGTLDLAGTFNQPTLGTVAAMGGPVIVTGTISGGLALNAATGSWTLNGGTISGGTISESGGAKLWFYGAVLDSVIFNGDMDLSRGGSNSVSIDGDFTLNGTAFLGSNNANSYGKMYFGDHVKAAGILDGNGTIVFGSAIGNEVYNYNTPTLTIGAGITIRGSSGRVYNSSDFFTIVNQGRISADTPGGMISVGGYGTFTNAGELDATGGTLTVYGKWSNTGTINITNSTVNLGGSFTQAGMGTINRTGGVVAIAGTITGGVTLDATTGSWTLAGGTINGGSLNESGGAQLVGSKSGGYLIAVTVNGDLDLTQQDGANLTADGILVLNGTAYLGKADGSTSGQLYFGDDHIHATRILEGSATVLFGANANNEFHSYSTVFGSAGTLTIAPGVIVHGSTGTIYYGSPSGLINQGVINADVVGGTITVGYLDGVFSNVGAMEATAGTLALGGIFTMATLGNTQPAGGAVTITGTISGGLTLSAATGSWSLNGGTISGGTVSENDGARLLSTAKGGTLNGVTLNGDLDLRQPTDAQVTVLGTLSLNGTAYLGSADGSTFARMFFGIYDSAAGNLAGTATVVFGANNYNLLYNLSSVGTAPTIGPGITVRGNNGSIGSQWPVGLVNQGTIVADTPGGIINVGSFADGALSNTGVLAATAGTLSVRNALNLSGGTLTGGTWEAFSGGKLILPFPVTSVAATVVLDGAGSAITDSGGVNSALAGFSAISSGGSVSLQNGQSLSVAPGGGTLTDHGTINLGAGSHLSVTGAFTQAADGTFVTQLSGPTSASFGQITATGAVTLGGALQATLGAGYEPAAGQTFAIVTGSSRAGSFSSFSGGTTPGGLPLLLNYSATSAVISVNPIPLSYVGTQIDDGNRQRSLVRSLTFSFSSAVTLSAGAITLAKLNTGGSGANDGSAPTDASVALGTPTSSDGGLSWVVPIVASAFSSFGSLNDGVYTATVHASLVTDSMGQYLPGDQTKTFHRLFGDINGDKRVNATDYQLFVAAFGALSTSPNYVVYLDYQHDGRIISNDYQQFAGRFGKFFVYTG